MFYCYALNLSETKINHKIFKTAYQLIAKNEHDYFEHAVEDIEKALQTLYGKQKISLQQLSATFRWGGIDRGFFMKKIR